MRKEYFQFGNKSMNHLCFEHIQRTSGQQKISILTFQNEAKLKESGLRVSFGVLQPCRLFVKVMAKRLKGSIS